MSPVTVGGDFLCGIERFVDPHPVGAEFDVPVAGGADIERHHLVVCVPAQGGRQLESVGVDAVECLAEVKGLSARALMQRFPAKLFKK